MLAAAGINRLALDLSQYFVLHFDPREFVPAPAQGVLAYQTHESDLTTRRILNLIHPADVASTIKVERKILNLMQGGCQMPIGVYCQVDTIGNYHVWAAKASSWDAPIQRVRLSSSTSFNLPEQVVEALNNGTQE
jgi:hydroxymethylbilane synthase